MPAMCALSGKSYHKVTKRSKSMQSHIVRLKPNLILCRVGNKKVKVSARALKTLKKKGQKLSDFVVEVVR